MTGRDVIPTATIRTSVTSGAPASNAARPARNAFSSHTRSPAQLGSALVCTTRSTTARVSGGRSDVSSRLRMIEYDSISMGCGTRAGRTHEPVNSLMAWASSPGGLARMGPVVERGRGV